MGTLTEKSQCALLIPRQEVKNFLKTWAAQYTNRGVVSGEPLLNFEGKASDYATAVINKHFQKGYALVLDGTIVRIVGNQKVS